MPRVVVMRRAASSGSLEGDKGGPSGGTSVTAGAAKASRACSPHALEGVRPGLEEAPYFFFF